MLLARLTLACRRASPGSKPDVDNFSLNIYSRFGLATEERVGANKWLHSSTIALAPIRTTLLPISDTPTL